MPYINPQRRIDLLSPLNDFDLRQVKTLGELNYVLTTVAVKFLQAQPRQDYTTMSAVLGQFEAAKLEFYRRVIAPYEDGQLVTNGDVYSTSTY